ncbi:MAG: N-acetyltransferase [Candidatus Zixiibacteriota bacterium]
MSSIEVVEVETPAQLNSFINYSNELYQNEPNYVMPLTVERKEFFSTEKNPFYRIAKVKLFLAMRDRTVCGRIATCINYTHNDYHHEKVGFFGFFDTPDDSEIASKLLKVAMITLKREGMEKMRGPMNFSTNHEIGFLVEGFDRPPAVMMTYNYPYQPQLAEKFGLKKVMDLLGFILTKETPIPERILKVTERFQSRSQITLRPLNMADFDNEVKRINAVYNQAWAPNWGFVPMDETEFFYMAKNLRQIVDPHMVFIAEHEGKPVAFSIAVPDINQALIYLKGKLFPFGLVKLFWHTKIKNKVNGVRLITMGVIPEFQKRGVDMMLFVNTYQTGVKRGYTWAELSWILETNELMCRAAEDMGAKVFKKYRIMEMPL